jgi:hypothetical protein
VNAPRLVSPRFVIALIATTSYVVLVQQIAGSTPSLYLGVLGALVVVELTVHIRHLRNWFVFKYGLFSIQGRLVYPRCCRSDRERLDRFRMPEIPWRDPPPRSSMKASAQPLSHTARTGI